MTTKRPSNIDAPIPFALAPEHAPIPYRLPRTRTVRLTGTLDSFIVPAGATPVPAHERPSAPSLSEAV